MKRQTYSELIVEEKIPEHVPPGRVPQTIFWIVEDGSVVGMLRMRHFPNESLRVTGGHIGYYIRPSAFM